MSPRNKKRLKFSLFMVILLVASYFWSGTKGVNPTDMDAVAEEEQKVNIVVNEDYKDKLEKEKDEKAQLKKEREEKAEAEKLAQEEAEKKAKEEKEKLLAQVPDEKKELVEKAMEKSPEEIANIKQNQAQEKEQIIAADSNKGGKDKYQTDPVPEGKPKPVEWQDVEIDKSKPKTATLSVRCDSILNNMHLFNMDKIDVLPIDGTIYARQQVTFYEGESVFDVLLREMQNNRIHMEFQMTPIYNSHYVEGINNLYEFDCGELSGWMYRVNGWFPNYGASRYMLEEGDIIEWIYTCDLGRDIGGGAAVGGY